LHFDLIICNKAFDETTCIAHFIDELIFYNWIFSLMNHKKKTLLSIFKDLINQCDRIKFDERAIFRIIRIDQEIFIDKKFEDWVREQENNWDWSTKNISEQNEKFERFDDILIEKQNASKSMSNCQKIFILNAISSLRTYWIERRRHHWAETHHWFSCKNCWKNQFEMRLLISKCLIAKRFHFQKKQMHSKEVIKWSLEHSSNIW
jgi:hypothetical protein